jgi:DNA-binding SARP family transcriptional activator
MMFVGFGQVLRGDDASVALEHASASFAELGATAVVALIDDVRANVSRTRRAALNAATRMSVAAPAMSASPASMRVYCFDALELVIDNTPIDLSGVRPRALSVLRMLALHAGRLVHREVLMDALWPGVEPSAARHSLHVAMSSLRKVVPERPSPTIVRHGDAYRLELVSGAFCDVRMLQAHLASATVAMTQGDHRRAFNEAIQAADVYRGDLLLDEGPADWVVGHRDMFRLEMVRACSMAGEAALKLDLPAEATRMAERGLSVDRYADPLWRILVDSHEQSHDTASAERVRRAWQDMMHDLGVA